ncbi:molybdopterin molybdotransferase MoeA (plasmid) [Microvirga terrae]|uniref:Molybdopterin molybdenumtransferase n=1 Tax=Microvirga terrae TaxID=2740529 RepID=A0ABY5RYR6_9HYPH|nr:gephyrin-like molybdotransferase Glp [Microvirga terrae]UVF22183.1 molybdopterin molybdotransferase MoeA [Microvirga terrae]
MAQLSNDCFVCQQEVIRLVDALGLITERISSVTDSVIIPIEASDGRILAVDVLAPVDLPPFDNSAVDGYAVRYADLNASGESYMRIAARVTAGAQLNVDLPPGSAVRIFTGAPTPAQFDTVFMQEDATEDGENVRLPKGLRCGANRRLAGEDLKRGSIALRAGRRLSPSDIALLAALGRTTVVVRHQLRVALFSTGNEVIPPGRPLEVSKIYDANRFMLRALLERANCMVTDLGILPDSEAAVRRAIVAAADTHDLLVSSGGVSAGDEDHVRAAVASVGSLVFWRVSIKPGRPVAMGVAGGTPFIGLPGNPVAVFVTFALLARPLIARLAGEEYQPPYPVTVVSGFSYEKKAGRREYVRVRLFSRDGAVEAQKHPSDGAGVITSLTQTDGLLELPEHATRIEPGDPVGFLSYAELL